MEHELILLRFLTQGFFIFHVIVFFTVLYNLLVYVLRSRLSCSCEICKSYLTMSWSKDYDNLCDWYTHLLQNSPTKTINVHVLGNVITAQPTNVEYMLRTRFDNYPKGEPFSAILGDLLGRGIFNVDGELWKFQRKMASLELGRVSLRSYCFEIVHLEIENRLLPLISSAARQSEDRVLDLQDAFRRFSFDSICQISFGLDPMCLETSQSLSSFASSFDLASRLSAERALKVSPIIWKLKRFFNMGSEKKLKKAIKIINSLAEEVIRQRRTMAISTTHNKRDLLSLFMRSVDNDERYLRDIVISFLLAGRDTIASALTSLFWLLAKHPVVEEAILSEADRVIGKDRCPSSYDQMKELHYLEAAIYESMRLYPPVQFDSKFCKEDDMFPDGTIVKKGARVTYHPYAMGRMEEIWGKDCLEFKPERWLKDGVFAAANPYKYPVFQAGTRVCLGKEISLIELKTVVINLTRQFTMDVLSPSPSPRFSPGLTATFRGGLLVSVRERKIQ